MDKLVRELTERVTDGESIGGDDVLVRCPACGFELPVFRKTGRLGCPTCYTVFARELSLESASDDSEQEEVDEKSRLEAELREAIEREDYETAAQLRDRIRNLNSADKS